MGNLKMLIWQSADLFWNTGKENEEILWKTWFTRQGSVHGLLTKHTHYLFILYSGFHSQILSKILWDLVLEIRIDPLGRDLSASLRGHIFEGITHSDEWLLTKYGSGSLLGVLSMSSKMCLWVEEQAERSIQSNTVLVFWGPQKPTICQGLATSLEALSK